MHSNASAKLLWTNANGAVSTTLTASGNSGASLIDLRYATDVWLAVSVGANPTGTTPTLDVYLDVQDAAGNWFTQVLHATPQITTASGNASAYGGLYLPSGTGVTPLVLPEWGRASWAVGGTNPVYTKTTISLYGR